MSKYFKSLDIFGNSFSFTTFQHDKYKTTVGGLLSLICIVIAIIFTFLFGQDFFYRTNPKVRSQKVIPQFAQKINLTRDVLALPWRIEDDSTKPVNFDGLIYPKLSYYIYNYNEQNQLTLMKKIFFNITKCSEENVKFPQLYKQLNLSNYYCFDWEASDQKYTFGGFWDESFLHYFEINFDFCKERQYSKSNNCTSIEKLKSYFSSDNPWYFSIFYPQFTFSNENLEAPLKLVFKNYYYQFNLNSQKTDRWKFKQVILDDDQGWILPSNKNTSVISYDRIDNDFSLVLDDDLVKEGSKSTFYKTVFYLEKDFDLFNRSFMKVQDLAAVVGGFLKIILVIFGFISSLFNKSLRKIHLFYEMFECDFLNQDNTNIKNSKTYKFNTNNQKTIINNTSEIPLPSRISIRTNINRNNNLDHNLQNNRIDDKKLTKLENKTNFMSKPEEKNSVNNINQKSYNHNIIQSNFGMLFLIKKNLCTSMLSKEERRFNDILLLTNKYLNARLDVITYIRTLDTLDSIKSLLFNHYQNISLNFIKKQKISSQEDLDELQISPTEDKSKIKDLVEYYNKLTRTNTLSNIDRQLLPLLNDEIQKQIVKN
jgi:hypothetical protein